ncbi:hypothetical protein H310_14637 [Aphanomyces invadans]|uniref:Uncharacterized protein n=1 Tax=Aphanomyces invadans TaxID=157072 RepID=A0A024TAF3_9STRA|nr:hypothetical protein H310_14637 [Aphanomyces invadans]ETV90601.1 hypothetical protein H310_14637 [Aphanomyces invadans]|eukprot:XP_008880754.1 hypothetical protein H310_14637 [Aphanomyces invadans]
MAVWVYKYFAKSVEKRSPDRQTSLPLAWTVSDCPKDGAEHMVTVNVDWLKPFRSYYSRPFNDDIPEDDSPIDELTAD